MTDLRATRALPLGVLAAIVIAACSDSSGGGGAPSTVGPTNDWVVATTGGLVQGDPVGGVRRFLKIPYAKPPTGPLRWKAPEKPDPWTGTRHETAFAEACSQNASTQGAASTNEDCLYLNVWAPEPVPVKAPVMIWIHGGGNFAGSAGDLVPAHKQLWYDGQFFAARHGVVVVSMNYRLGPMGFFSHAALGAEGSPLGNQGLLDQRAVFEWVRDNAAAFGGDPDNVTIFGESAGSADVCYHVASPLSRGLFHRAISESGGCTVALGGGKEPTAAAASAAAAPFVSALGCAGTPDELACLRSKPASAIMANASQPDLTGGAPSPGAAVRFGVVVDGAFLPSSARSLYDAGNVAKVPYI